MRRFLNIVIAAAVLVLTPALVLAQETTGSISGTVTDPSSKPVSFATVSVRSSGAERQVTTDDNGRFLVAFLTPGSYTVVVSADGYGSLTDEGVSIGLGVRTARKYVLQPIMEESLTVEASEEAPEPVISSLSETTSGSNIPAELAESIPLGRNISSVVFLTPNVKSGGGTGASNPSISGSSGFENQYVFDGVNVTNAGYGALGAFSNVYGSQGTGINFNFVKETQVVTNGFAAEFGQATGGIVNLVTKSGSNEWEGSVYGYFTPDGTQASFRTPELEGFDIAPTLGVQRMDYGFDVGGPIVKDKLFFWLGANPGSTTTTRRSPYVDDDGDGVADYQLYYEGNQELKSDSLNWAAKLTLQPTPDHRIDLSAFGDPRETNYSFNRGSSALNADDKDRFTKLKTGYDNFALNYNGTINSKLLAEATIAHSKNTFEELLTPAGDQWQGFDITGLQTGTGGGFVLGGIGYVEPGNTSKNTQFGFKFTSLIGDHELKYGVGYEDIKYGFTTAYTGPQITTRGPDGVMGTADDQRTESGVYYQRRLDCSLLGNANVTETVFVDDPNALAALGCPDTDGDGVPDPANVPVVYRVTQALLASATRETDSQYTYAFVQDTWHTTPNVAVNFGMRYEKQRISGNQMAYGFPQTWSPRVGVSWDHTHEGKSKLYGFWGRFYEKVPLDMAVRALSEEFSLFRGVYYDAQMTQAVPQGVGIGTRYLTSGTGTTEIVGGTKNSYTDGWSAGYERDLGKGWSLKTEWQYRKLGDALEDFANVPMSDIALGYNGFGNYIIGNIPPTTPIDNSGGGISGAYYPGAEREYQSLTVEGTHRSENWFLSAQYALSNLHGNYEGLFRNDNGQSDPNLTSLWDFPNEELFYYTFANGTLNTNRTHRLQTYGYYTWENGWSVGARFVGQSGTPRQKLASHPVYENGGEISLVRRGDLGDTGFEYGLDFNFGKKWQLPTNFASEVELTVDIFNILNRKYATSWDWDNDSGVELDTCTVDPADPTCATLEQQYQRLLDSVANGVPNPDYSKATGYSAPREMRFGVTWRF